MSGSESETESESELDSGFDSSGIYIYQSRVYCDAIEKLGSDWADLESFRPEWGSPKGYVVKKKVGRGKFSTVYLAKNPEGKRVALKVLVPVDIRKYIKEIKILRNLNGHENIVQLLDLVQDKLTGINTLVFEWITIRDWKHVYGRFGPDEVKYYMRKLLEGLDYAHSKGIIHRDLKPQNIGVNEKKGTLKILDWGLAEFYFPGKKLNPYAGTKAFMSPEQLIGYPYYSYAIDMWAAGLIFGTMLFKKQLLGNCQSTQEQLIAMAELIGGRPILNLLQVCEIGLNANVYEKITGIKGVGFDKYLESAPEPLRTPEACDLFKKMTHYDFRFRITAREALEHPYFK